MALKKVKEKSLYGFDASGHTVENVGNPVGAGDAANKAYVDGTFGKSMRLAEGFITSISPDAPKPGALEYADILQKVSEGRWDGILLTLTYDGSEWVLTRKKDGTSVRNRVDSPHFPSLPWLSFRAIDTHDNVIRVHGSGVISVEAEPDGTGMTVRRPYGVNVRVDGSGQTLLSIPSPLDTARILSSIPTVFSTHVPVGEFSAASAENACFVYNQAGDGLYHEEGRQTYLLQGWKVRRFSPQGSDGPTSFSLRKGLAGRLQDMQPAFKTGKEVTPFTTLGKGVGLYRYRRDGEDTLMFFNEHRAVADYCASATEPTDAASQIGRRSVFFSRTDANAERANLDETWYPSGQEPYGNTLYSLSDTTGVETGIASMPAGKSVLAAFPYSSEGAICVHMRYDDRELLVYQTLSQGPQPLRGRLAQSSVRTLQLTPGHLAAQSATHIPALSGTVLSGTLSMRSTSADVESTVTVPAAFVGGSVHYVAYSGSLTAIGVLGRGMMLVVSGNSAYVSAITSALTGIAHEEGSSRAYLSFSDASLCEVDMAKGTVTRTYPGMGAPDIRLRNATLFRDAYTRRLELGRWVGSGVASSPVVVDVSGRYAVTDGGITLPFPATPATTAWDPQGGEVLYTPAPMPPSTPVSSPIGMIASGSTLGELSGKSVSEVISMMLVKRIAPVVTGPSLSLSYSPSTSIYEVASNVPSVTITPSFSRGSIVLNGTSQGPASGALTGYSTTAPTAGIDATSSASAVTVAAHKAVFGSSGVTVVASYGAGPMPKDNMGADVPASQIAAGTSTSRWSYEGAYAYYATTISTTQMTKQPLANNRNEGAAGGWVVDLCAEPEGASTRQSFAVPKAVVDARGGVADVETWNALLQKYSSNMADWSSTPMKMNMPDGTQADYVRYIYKGLARGAVRLRLRFAKTI